MKLNIADFFDSVVSGDTVTAQRQFENIVHNKIDDRIDSERQSVADSVFIGGGGGDTTAEQTTATNEGRVVGVNLKWEEKGKDWIAVTGAKRDFTIFKSPSDGSYILMFRDGNRHDFLGGFDSLEQAKNAAEGGKRKAG